MNKRSTFPVATSFPCRDLPTASEVKLSACHPVASRMFGDGLLADASQVSSAEFFAAATDRFFPAPPKTRLSELAEASRRYISAAWVAKDVSALREAYVRELDEIEERWALSEVRKVRHLGREGYGA